MCAMIPMFRLRASVTWRVTFSTFPGLPLEMAEGLVGLGHLVRVFASLDRRAEAVHGVDELGRELLAHALAVSLSGGLDQPADAEREAAITADLDGNLVRRATDAAGLDLDDGARVAEGVLEDLEARSLGRCLGASEGLAQDPLGQVLLAIPHELRVEAGRRPIGRDLLVLGLASDTRAARHQRFP